MTARMKESPIQKKLEEPLRSSTEAKPNPVNNGEPESSRTRREIAQSLLEVGTYIEWADPPPNSWQNKLPGCLDEEL